jgi:phage terminase large subunit-like protein
MITTAGTDKEESRCGELYDYGRMLERGEVRDDGFFFRWWEAPEGCDHRDPEMWKLANPSYGVTIREDFYRGELAGTNVGAQGERRGAISEAEFRRLYLNQWVDYGEAPWVTADQIAACRLEGFELREGIGTWLGADLSETRDSTAIVVGQWWSEDRPCGHTDEPCLYIRARTWEAPLGPDGRPLGTWEVPQAEVKQHIRDLNASFNVLTNVFDPWHSKLMRQDLENEGLQCEEIHQTGARRSGASASLYDLIIQERLHYCDPLFERHVLNATIRATGTDGGYFLAKRRKGKVMDAAMAAVNVVYGTIYEPDDLAEASVFFA